MLSLFYGQGFKQIKRLLFVKLFLAFIIVIRMLSFNNTVAVRLNELQ